MTGRFVHVLCALTCVFMLGCEDDDRSSWPSQDDIDAITTIGNVAVAFRDNSGTFDVSEGGVYKINATESWSLDSLVSVPAGAYNIVVHYWGSAGSYQASGRLSATFSGNAGDAIRFEMRGGDIGGTFYTPPELARVE